MNHRLRIALYIATGLATGLLAGCFSPKPDDSKFYVLSALPASAAPTTPVAGNVSALGVFAPNLPTYLDQPQIVARTGSNQVSQNDYQRWSEPLAGGFSRVLVQDLEILGQTDKVAMYPLTRTFDQEFEVYVTVFQFDGVPGGNVTLQATWRITGPGGKPNFVVQKSLFTQASSASTSTYDGYVATLSALVGDLAKAIVAALPEAKAKEAEEAAAAAKIAADKAAVDAAEEAAMAAKVAEAKVPASTAPVISTTPDAPAAPAAPAATPTAPAQP